MSYVFDVVTATIVIQKYIIVFTDYTYVPKKWNNIFKRLWDKLM